MSPELRRRCRPGARQNIVAAARVARGSAKVFHARRCRRGRRL